MKNADLMGKYIKLKKAKNAIQILICKIGWDSPSEMISKWKIGKSFQTVVPATEIEQAVVGIIEDPRFSNYVQIVVNTNPLA